MNEVSFAQEVKNEISLNQYSKDQLKYILSGFIRINSTLSLSKNPSLILKTKLVLISDLLIKAFREVYGIDCELQYQNVGSLNKKLSYIIIVKDIKLYSILNDLEILDESIERVQIDQGLDDDNFRYLVIGCFLASGSINNPSTSKTPYFLEISFSSEDDSKRILEKLLSFREEKAMNFKYVLRRDKHVLYLKKSDQISVFLSYLGAFSSMFKYENARIAKENENISNRLAICDAQNYKRSIETVKKDIDDINILLSHKKIEDLDDTLKLIIKYRKENLESSYRELSELIFENEGIEISKSGIAHAFAKIRSEVSKYKQV